MGAVTIRDDALWVKHIHDPEIRRQVVQLHAGERVRLVVDGCAIAFKKMRDGIDGRPTSGLRADADDIDGYAAWTTLQARRGETVPLFLAANSDGDPYLAYLDELFSEWKTAEDAAAFDDL